MPKQLIPLQIVIDYSPRGPKIIRATDDLENDAKFRNRGEASTDLLKEVFDKLLANRQSGAEVKLATDDDGFIIVDPNLSPSSSSASSSAPPNPAGPAPTAVPEVIVKGTIPKKRSIGRSKGKRPKKKGP